MRNKGFALVELLIAVLIISVGIASAAFLQNRLSTEASFSQDFDNATQLAVEKINQLRITGYSFISAGSHSDQLTIGRTKFTRDTAVSTHVDPDYKMVQVNVTWLDEQHNAHTVNFTTIIANIGFGNSSG